MTDERYFETMRWHTRIPGMVRDADTLFARYTTPHGSVRYILANKIDAGVPTAQMDALIEAEIARAQREGVMNLTWRIHGRDACTALPQRLMHRGFTIDGVPCTQCFANVERLAQQLASAGAQSTLKVRELTQASEIEAYLPIWEQCFPQQSHRRYIEDYKRILVGREGGVRFFAAFDGRQAVASGYTFHNAGAQLALLCGGATMPAYRQRGVYRALLARRVQSAQEDGVHTLCVDASPHSAPILQRLGFAANDTVAFYQLALTPSAAAEPHSDR
jgi:GNAT superfamily N-acetyltransferase